MNGIMLLEDLESCKLTLINFNLFKIGSDSASQKVSAIALAPVHARHSNFVDA